jgi:hypothetical protein
MSHIGFLSLRKIKSNTSQGAGDHDLSCCIYYKKFLEANKIPTLSCGVLYCNSKALIIRFPMKKS